MNYKQLTRFYDDLATMLNSGLTLQRGVALMKKGKKDSLLWMLDSLHDYLGRGGALWEGMKQFPKHFDPFQIMTVKAGEESGTLVDTMRGLSRYYEMREKERKRLIGGLIYPVVLLHAVVLLPPLKYLIVSSLDRSYWSIVLPVLLTAYCITGFGVFLWKTILKDGPFRQRVDEIILGIPYLGKLTGGMALVRVFHALSGLYNAGVPPVMAARQSVATAGNQAIAQKLESALPVLENGGTFTNFFSFAAVLPPTQLGILSVAEETGTLPESLQRMAMQMEEDTAQRFTSFIKTLGYLAYLVAASIVAYTVVSFYSGYFTLV